MTTAPLDFQNIDIETLMILEDHGVELADMAALDPDRVPARMLAAISFIKLRATDPSATWEQACKAKLADLGDLAAQLEQLPPES